MANDFENHCWKDVVSPDVLDIYAHYARNIFVGPSPALLAIDLYELAYQGGAKPVAELHKTYPSSCGEYAHAAIEPTKRLVQSCACSQYPDLLHHSGYATGWRTDPRHCDQATGCSA